MTSNDPATPIVAPTLFHSTWLRVRRRWLAAFVLLLVMTVGGYALWCWHWPRRQIEPPLPTDVQNPEVRAAIENARGDIIKKPAESKLWGELGMILQVHQFYHEADQCYAVASQLDRNDSRWPYARGLIAVKRGNLEESIPFFQAVSSCNGKAELHPLALLQLAEVLLERGQSEEARSLFQQVEQREPENPRALYGLGLIAAARQEPASKELLARARSSPYFRKQATAVLARAARLREDPQAAELEREVNNLPDDLPWPDPFVQELMTRRVGQATTQTEAERLEKLEQYGAAASAYLQQMESDPSVRAYLGAGLNLARIDQFDRALPLLREAIQKDPDNHKAHFALVKVLVARVEKAEKRVPPSQNVLEWYGEIRDHARRVIELKPDNARAYLFWGMALRALEKPNDAIAAFREGIAANPLDIDLRFALAEIYLERGEMVQAAKTLEDARLIDSRDPRLAHLVHQLNQKKP